MSDDPLDQLQRAYARAERQVRWNQITLTAGIAVLGLLNAGLSLLYGGPRGLGDALRFLGMTGTGLVACYGAMALYRAWKRQNAELLGLYRSAAPLMQAISEAHGQGMALLVAPPEPEDPAHTVH